MFQSNTSGILPRRYALVSQKADADVLLSFEKGTCVVKKASATNPKDIGRIEPPASSAGYMHSVQTPYQGVCKVG